MSRYSSLAFVFLCLCNLYSLEAFNGEFIVELIHRDSPKSPFYNSSETQFQRIANALRRSIIRLNYFNKSFVSPNTPQAPITSALGEYLMSYSIGTPPVQSYGILDTGSDITWLQCRPCQSCFKQSTPIFDPSKSKTYKTISCTSNVCRSCTPNICRSVYGPSSAAHTRSCKYFIHYFGGAQSQGDLSLETLTLGSTNASPVKTPRIAIGCGHKNRDFERGHSGIVGLGRGTVSLINQS